MKAHVSKGDLDAARHFFATARTGLNLAAATFALALPSIGFAMPPDPQRSFEVADCSAAQDRLKEALIGSPLISAAENDEVVKVARRWVEQLCAADEASEG